MNNVEFGGGKLMDYPLGGEPLRDEPASPEAGEKVRKGYELTELKSPEEAVNADPTCQALEQLFNKAKLMVTPEDAENASVQRLLKAINDDCDSAIVAASKGARQKNVEKIREMTPVWLERGKALVDPSRHEDWEKYVDGIAKRGEVHRGEVKSLEMALGVMEDLKNGVSYDEIDETRSMNGETAEGYELANKIVAGFVPGGAEYAQQSEKKPRLLADMFK